MAPSLAMLNLRAVGRRFGDDQARWVLDGINLTVQSGEFICLIGPSGSGKTTLMRVIGGIDKPDRGQRLLAQSPSLRIAMVFQEPRLVPWISVLDNLLLVAGSGAAARARALLRRVELDDYAASYPGQLSGGMQRRVALARALLIDPQVLLLDEPLTSLDTALEERMTHVLRGYWQEHRPSVIMVTHDPRQPARLASRVIGLAAGQAGLALDEDLATPPPGNRTTLDEASIIRRLVKICPILPIAS